MWTSCTKSSDGKYLKNYIGANLFQQYDNQPSVFWHIAIIVSMTSAIGKYNGFNIGISKIQILR